MYIAGWENPPINKQTTNPEAFRFYQLGVYFANVRNKETWKKRFCIFKTIELDPKIMHFLIQCWQILIIGLMNMLMNKRAKELIEKSEEASKKLLP